jgi:hypothetical protein
MWIAAQEGRTDDLVQGLRALLDAKTVLNTGAPQIVHCGRLALVVAALNDLFGAVRPLQC